MRAILLGLALLVSASEPVNGPTNFSVEYYGRESYPAWPYKPCGNGPFEARIGVQRKVLDPNRDDFTEPDYQWSLPYSVTIEKVDSNAWVPPGSNITIPAGPIRCDPGVVEYFIVSGLQKARVPFAIGDPGHGSIPVVLYNSATHVARTWTVKDPWDEKYLEMAGFYVPNDPSLIGLSIYHQGFIVYRGNDGFLGVLSSRGVEIRLEK